MLADEITPIKARILALQAGAALLLLVILSNSTFNLFGFTVPFLFLPLILIYFWPRGGDPGLTYLVLFICGLFHDFLSGSSPGVWPMIFMLGWALTRPYLYSKDVGLTLFWISFTVWMGILAFLFLVMDYWGQDNIAYTNILYQALIAIVIFPLLYAVRLFFKNTIISAVD